MTVAVDGRGTTRARVVEWIRRYLPCEIISTVFELGGAVVAYAVTDSLAAAALAATIGGFAGYYGMAFVNALRWSYRDVLGGSRLRRALVANLLALRSITVEFGAGEAVDSLLVRPATYYALPRLLGDDVVLGWLIAKVVSDVAFYACTILSCERFSALVAVRQRRDDSGQDGVGAPGVSIVADNVTRGS